MFVRQESGIHPLPLQKFIIFVFWFEVRDSRWLIYFDTGTFEVTIFERSHSRIYFVALSVIRANTVSVVCHLNLWSLRDPKKWISFLLQKKISTKNTNNYEFVSKCNHYRLFKNYTSPSRQSNSCRPFEQQYWTAYHVCCMANHCCLCPM